MIEPMPYAASTDTQLLARLRAGDEAAFTAFFHDYFPRLHRFVLPRVGRDAALAEELSQQVLARAMPRLHAFRGEASLFTWLCQIARHELADYWQRRGRDAEQFKQFDDDESLRAALESLEGPEALQPEAVHSQVQLARLVQVALDHLPPHYAAILEWQYIDGLSVQQIAARQGQTLIAAQSALARARRAFQDVFSAFNRVNLEDLI
jgi:RNA polymerase sigma-70 factor (ECF subfamily)